MAHLSGSTLVRATLALLGMLALSACLVTPGKFDSTLDIRADRSFHFTYKGEILASDMGKDLMSMPESGDDGTPGGQESTFQPALLQIAATEEERFDGNGKGDNDAQMQAIASALLKEKGFRTARYVGNNKFEIDYAIDGRLTHSFLFPFNLDAQIVLPFVAVELRGDDRVRMRAPGFANSSDKTQGPMGTGGPGDAAAKALNGTFTLTTDAEIVSQNQEDGAQTTAQGKQISWKITPLTSEAPAATLRVQR